MLETYENWFNLANSCINYACQTHEINQVLPYSVDFKSLSKCSFIWDKGTPNIWNDRKAQK